MKPEFKVEGDVLKIGVKESKSFDADGDGLPSLEASLDLQLQAHGMEVFDELMKSSSLAQKIKEKLGA